MHFSNFWFYGMHLLLGSLGRNVKQVNIDTNDCFVAIMFHGVNALWLYVE